MGPGSATTATAAPCVTTGDAVDEDVEDADDARNDGLDHGADGVDNATKAVADA